MLTYLCLSSDVVVSTENIVDRFELVALPGVEGWLADLVI